MSKSINDQTIAMAGMMQALYLVVETARHGRQHPEAMSTVLESLFVESPEGTLDVYGGRIEPLADGLRTLIFQLGTDSQQVDMDINRYLMMLLHLERKLAKRPQVLDALFAGLARVARQREHFELLLHESVIGGMAELYSQTISTLGPKIMVRGDQRHLLHGDNANKVRALLLAAMRAAVLWRQVGGSRLQLLFRRKRYLGEARALLNTIENI